MSHDHRGLKTTGHVTGSVSWLMVEGLDCEIIVEPRPSYCDRGSWIAKIHPKAGGDPLRLSLDVADGWPRYYFDFDRCLDEIQAWLEKRGQLPNG